MTAEQVPLRAIVGARIRAVRRARGLSAQDLADALGWPLDTLVNYEYGRRPLQLDRLAALADALAISPAALLVADPAASEVVGLLDAHPLLAQDVRFFIDALQAEQSPPGEAPERQA